MALGDFGSYPHAGNPQFFGDLETGLGIRTELGDRGTYMANYEGELPDGEQLLMQAQVTYSEGSIQNASIICLFYDSLTATIPFTSSGVVCEAGGVWSARVDIPENAAKARFDLRYWGGPGSVTFREPVLDLASLPPEPPVIPTPELHPILNAEQLPDFVVAWDAVEAPVNYVLQHRVGEEEPTVIYLGPETSFQVIGAAVGEHQYRVQAVGEESDSAWSEYVSTTVVVEPVEPDAPVYNEEAITFLWPDAWHVEVLAGEPFVQHGRHDLTASVWTGDSVRWLSPAIPVQEGFSLVAYLALRAHSPVVRFQLLLHDVSEQVIETRDVVGTPHELAPFWFGIKDDVEKGAADYVVISFAVSADGGEGSAMCQGVQILPFAVVEDEGE